MSLNVISSRADARIIDIVKSKHVVTGRADFENLLDDQCGVATTLDLIGHSIDGHLELGDWLIDETAMPWFRIHAAALRAFESVRLIACHTAVSPGPRQVICEISDVLGLDVFGSTGFLFHYHYTASGFDPAWRFLLTPASALRYREDTQRNPIS